MSGSGWERKVLEERILDNRVQLSLREVLGIGKKEFHDSIMDLEAEATLDRARGGEARGGEGSAH